MSRKWFRTLRKYEPDLAAIAGSVFYAIVPRVFLMGIFDDQPINQCADSPFATKKWTTVFKTVEHKILFYIPVHRLIFFACSTYTDISMYRTGLSEVIFISPEYWYSTVSMWSSQ